MIFAKVGAFASEGDNCNERCKRAFKEDSSPFLVARFFSRRVKKMSALDVLSWAEKISPSK